MVCFNICWYRPAYWVLDMEIEQLKVIAEGMGIEVEDTTMLGLTVVKSNSATYLRHAYNPIKNNDQMVEIMEKLKLHTWWFEKDKLWKSVRDSDLYTPTFIGLGKTIREAVCNTAHEYFKGVADA